MKNKDFAYRTFQHIFEIVEQVFFNCLFHIHFQYSHYSMKTTLKNNKTNMLSFKWPCDVDMK